MFLVFHEQPEESSHEIHGHKTSTEDREEKDEKEEDRNAPAKGITLMSDRVFPVFTLDCLPRCKLKLTGCMEAKKTL